MNLLERIFELGHEIIIVLDRDGRVVDWSREAERLYQGGSGASALASLGPGRRWIDAVSSHERVRAQDWLMSLGTAGQPGTDLITRMTGHAQNLVYVEWRGDSDGREVVLYGHDITPWKESADGYRGAMERFEIIAQASNDGIWDWNLETNEIYLSRNWKSQLGFEDQDIPNRFDSFTHHVHADDRPRFVDALKNYSIGNSHPFDLTIRMVRKQGDIRWMRIRAEAVRNQGGMAVRVAGTHEDVTEEYHARERVELERDRLEGIIQGTGAGTWEWYIATGTLVLNERWGGIIGYTLEELVPHTFNTWLAHTHPEDHGVFINALEQHIAGVTDYYEAEFRMKHRAGHWVWVLSRGRVLRRDAEGKPLLMAGIHQDMTQRHEVLDLFNRLFLENPGLLVLCEHRDGTIIQVNRALTRRTGFTEAALVGQPAGVLGLDITCMEEGCVADQEAWLLAQGGDRIPVLLGMEHIQTGTQDVLLLVMTDIGTQKEAERLAREAEQLSFAASQAKSEFLANMSHEIRTPLNSVIGFTDLLRDTDLDPTQREYVESAHGSAKSLLELISDILDFSKIEAGKLELHPSPVDVADVCEQVTNIIKPLAAQKGLQLSHHHPDHEHGPLLIDALRLRQVLVNLLGNAVKFSSRGTVSLEVSHESVAGVDRLWDHTFRVRDEGIGMSADQVARLFSPFTQVDGSATRKFGGTGLGLVISKRLVEALGGSLKVESEVGVGSTFWFTIRNQEVGDVEHLDPLALRTLGAERKEKDDGGPPPSSADVVPIARGGEEGPAPMILLAEDAPMNMVLLRIYVRRIFPRCELVEAHDGREALRAWETSLFDLAVMDVQMPEMDGIEAVRAMRVLDIARGRRPPIIALTAGALTSERERCLEAGMDDFLTKPVEPQVLRDVLQTWLQKFRSADLGGGGEGTSAKGHYDHARLVERLGGDDALARTLMRNTHPHWIKDLDLLDRAIQVGDRQASMEWSHKIRGSALNFCCQVLADLSARCEATARDRDWDQARTLAGLMRRELGVLAVYSG